MLVKIISIISSLTLLSRFLGYLRDLLIAKVLGAGLISDCFFIAFKIPNLFRRLFAEGTFNAAFVPSYASEALKSKSKSNIFANVLHGLAYNFGILTFYMCSA